MNENTTATDHGYVLAYTAGGGQALHIVRRTADYYNGYAKTGLCGTAPAAKWGTGSLAVRWMTAGNDTTYTTAAEAAAARPVCKRCAAAARKAEAAAAEAGAPAEDTPARYSVPGRVSPAVIVAAKDLQPGTAVTGYLGSDPVTAVSAVAPHEGGGTEITWTTEGGNSFSEVVSNDHGVYTVPAAEAEDTTARGSHWAMEYPALNGTVVMQGHADYCRAHGHATHSNDGDISPWCPRCGAMLNGDTVTDAAMARALELAAMAAPGAHRVDTGRASDIFGRIPLRRNGRDAYTGALATVITYFQGGPGRGECVDAVIVAASGGDNHPQRVAAAHDALERLQGRVSGNITAGQYQTIATGPGGGVLFIFGTWEDGE